MSAPHRRLVTLAAIWVALGLLFVMLVVCTKPQPRSVPSVPTSTPTVFVFVLPAATSTPAADIFTAPTRPVVILDLLPMTPSTRVPTQTMTPEPTVTPMPPTPNTTPPTQKGGMWEA